MSQFLNWWWEKRNFTYIIKSGVLEMGRMHLTTHMGLSCGRIPSGSEDAMTQGEATRSWMWRTWWPIVLLRGKEARARKQHTVVMPDERRMETQTQYHNDKEPNITKAWVREEMDTPSPLTLMGKSTALQHLEVCLLRGTIDSDLKGCNEILFLCFQINKICRNLLPQCHKTDKGFTYNFTL